MGARQLWQEDPVRPRLTHEDPELGMPAHAPDYRECVDLA